MWCLELYALVSPPTPSRERTTTTVAASTSFSLPAVFFRACSVHPTPKRSDTVLWECWPSLAEPPAALFLCTPPHEVCYPFGLPGSLDIIGNFSATFITRTFSTLTATRSLSFYFPLCPCHVPLLTPVDLYLTFPFGLSHSFISSDLPLPRPRR